MRLFTLLSTGAALVSSLTSALPVDDLSKDKLLKIGSNEYRIASENDKLKLKKDNVGFIDVTSKISLKDAIEKGLVGDNKVSWLQQLMTIGGKQLDLLETEVPEYSYPKDISYKKQVSKVYENININNVYENLANFTSFYTRYYKSESGYESANWLLSRIEEAVAPIKSRVNVSKVDHKLWSQYSIIVSIPGKVEDIVVVGAHQDSTNLLLPSLSRAPGADDDGSGTVTILEALRVLSNADFKPHNTLEFHFYSAEEGGLLGSYDVFQSYRLANKTVIGMLQQDMTGSTAKSKENGIEEHFGLISDYTSVRLNDFIKLIIENYNSIPYHETKCGYACSDHASALEFGYPSSFLIESEFQYTSKFIHTVWDTIDRIDFDHLKEHIKLTVAFAYELANAKVKTK